MPFTPGSDPPGTLISVKAGPQAADQGLPDDLTVVVDVVGRREAAARRIEGGIRRAVLEKAMPAREVADDLSGVVEPARVSLVDAAGRIERRIRRAILEES